MAFDAAPTNRTVPDCRVCPVSTCPARQAQTATTWGAMVTQRPALMPGAKPLIAAGEAPRALFTVRAGCVKTFTLDADGNERVRGFYFPGDLVGLDALGAQRSTASAAAVVPSQVCAAQVVDLLERLDVDAVLSSRLLAQMRRELGMALALSGEYTADQRVAAFLVFVDERIGHEGVIRLPMTRRDMGSYLRLATETVCRVLTRFEQRGWITSVDKRIEIHDREALRDASGPLVLGTRVDAAPQRLAA